MGYRPIIMLVRKASYLQNPWRCIIIIITIIAIEMFVVRHHPVFNCTLSVHRQLKQPPTPGGQMPHLHEMNVLRTLMEPDT